MREDFGYCVKGVSDHKHKELMPDEIYQIFQNEYVNIDTPYELVDFLLKKSRMARVPVRWTSRWRGSR